MFPMGVQKGKKGVRKRRGHRRKGWWLQPSAGYGNMEARVVGEIAPRPVKRGRKRPICRRGRGTSCDESCREESEQVRKKCGFEPGEEKLGRNGRCTIKHIGKAKR